MSKKKIAFCVNCGRKIKRHERRLELRVGESTFQTPTKVSRYLSWIDTMLWLPKVVFDPRPKIYQHMKEKPL